MRHTPEAPILPPYPLLKPALRQGWRDRGTVRFGVAPAHAVVLGPVDTATGSFLTLLDGTRSTAQLEHAAEALGLPPGRALSVMARLRSAGLLDSTKAGTPEADAVRADSAAFDRLRPDLASLSVQHPEPAAALDRMGARRLTSVRVRGAGRVGAAVAALLSAAGVGRVEVFDGGRVEPWDLLPAGFATEQVGERRDAAARRLVRRVSPWSNRPASTSAPTTHVTVDPKHQPDIPPASGSATPTPGESGTPTASPHVVGGRTLTVLTPRDGLSAYAPDPALAGPLVEAGAPHLFAGVVEGTGVVGPLVLPGLTGCARCGELGRTDVEPAWPRLLAQWRSGRGSRGVAACDAALATMVAGWAAAQALTFLDGRFPPTTGARMECVLPGGAWESTPVSPHTDCSCGAAAPPVASAQGQTTPAMPAPDRGPARTAGGRAKTGGVRRPRRRTPDRAPLDA